VLPWVQSVKWRRADLSVDRFGVVRLNPQLARALVQKAIRPDKEVQAKR
jgi:CRISPR-associated protein Cas1